MQQSQLTGHLGDILKESIEVALSYMKANWQELTKIGEQNSEIGIEQLKNEYEKAYNSNFLKKYDIHVHLPEGAISKDSPSAGIAIVVALTSLFIGKAVRTNIAMTGEINLSGKVLPVGGLKLKLATAIRET